MKIHSPMHYVWVELFVLAFTLLAANLTPWQRLAAYIERGLSTLARHPRLCFLTLAAASILIRVVFLGTGLESRPLPLFHDEFSYLLGADTFAHFRLTNPQPAVPLAFETIHTNMWPTYESMYMPGTGLVLALGALLGLPWIAVVLTTALFCATLYWMVAGWLPRGYALAAAIAAIVTTGSMNWWFDNYFLLTLPALGGTLVLGSIPRVAARSFSSGQSPGPEANAADLSSARESRTQSEPESQIEPQSHAHPDSQPRSWRSTLPLGAGLVLLILTRPYEGFCLAFPAVLVLLWNLRRSGLARLAALSAAPIAMLGLTFAWLFYYNWRGTGHPLFFPYMLNYRDYHITGPFLFSKMKAIPAYHNVMLARFFPGAELPQYDFAMHHPVDFLLRKVLVYYTTYLFGLGALVLLGAAYLGRHMREGLFAAPLLAFAGFCVEIVLMAWAPFPQYAAPAMSVFFLLIAFAFYAIRHADVGLTFDSKSALKSALWTGPNLLRGLVLAELLVAVNVFALRIEHRHLPPEPQYVSIDRERVEQVVLEHPGKQLCLVRYTEGHDGWQEWVFNSADLPTSRLVWARSLSPEIDRQVIAAYPDRKIWLVTPDFANSLLEDYKTGVVVPLPPNKYRQPGL